MKSLWSDYEGMPLPVTLTHPHPYYPYDVVTICRLSWVELHVLALALNYTCLSLVSNFTNSDKLSNNILMDNQLQASDTIINTFIKEELQGTMTCPCIPLPLYSPAYSAILSSMYLYYMPFFLFYSSFCAAVLWHPFVRIPLTTAVFAPIHCATVVINNIPRIWSRHEQARHDRCFWQSSFLFLI